METTNKLPAPVTVAAASAAFAAAFEAVRAADERDHKALVEAKQALIRAGVTLSNARRLGHY